MKKLLELLTQAEAEAKRLADADNSNNNAQILRAKVRSALEFAESPACSPAAIDDSAPRTPHSALA